MSFKNKNALEIINKAKEEVRKEEERKAVDTLKGLYRELRQAEELVYAVKRKISIEEVKLGE